MRYLLLGAGLLSLTACEFEAKYQEDKIYGDEDSVVVVYAKTETVPVESSDDAADDPAIWYNQQSPADSLILGTDKQSGLGIYTLGGQLMQFIPAGRPNNIDLRQGLNLGHFQGDLAAASNRDGDVVTLFAIDADGGRIIGDFAAGLEEPYGSCMGIVSGQPVVFVTYKTGEVQAHLLQDVSDGQVSQTLLGTIKLETQLEGCAYDDAAAVLYIGEEERGLWSSDISLTGTELGYTELRLVDEVDTASGITADVEGVSLYTGGDSRYVVISSQGNDSYAVYDRNDGNRFVGRFRIGNNEMTGIDGAQETDGIEVSAHNFGPDYPRGIVLVQDGFNAPVGEAQNFKIIDWRDVEEALGL